VLRDFIDHNFLNFVPDFIQSASDSRSGSQRMAASAELRADLAHVDASILGSQTDTNSSV
jgi:hypothetical protein